MLELNKSIIEKMEMAVNGKGYKRNQIFEVLASVLNGKATRMSVWSGTTQAIIVNDTLITICMRKDKLVRIDTHTEERIEMHQIKRGIWTILGKGEVPEADTVVADTVETEEDIDDAPADTVVADTVETEEDIDLKIAKHKKDMLNKIKATFKDDLKYISYGLGIFYITLEDDDYSNTYSIFYERDIEDTKNDFYNRV